MESGIYGYVRVSSVDQNEARQLLALEMAGVEKRHIYIDKASGKDFDRPEYSRLIRRMRAGDLLIIQSIDRLGRNYEEIQNQWRCLTKEKKVDIYVLDMPLLDTRQSKDLIGTFVADLVLQILSYVAETERVSIRKRQAEGIAAAKARGVRFGRPVSPLPDEFETVREAWKEKQITLKQAAFICKMPLSTFYSKVHNEK